tara:strand:- start:1209 stop:1616 length:408 start_codon:yes stop_codon:yes gene_type:complete
MKRVSSTPDPDRRVDNSGGPRPTEIKVRRAEKTLDIVFDDGAAFSLPAEYLRVESPSAEVQGHGPGQKVLVAGRRHVGIADIEAVGNYAIRIVFDDLHDTGLFSWRYLYQLGAEYETRWAEFTDALDAAGLSRDP